MNSNADLVARARAHIDRVCASLPYSAENLVRTGTIADERLALFVRLTNALGATLPREARRYVTVRPADEEPQVGELVQSKFSPSGTVWRIESVTPIAAGRRRTHELDVVSLGSGRRGTRYASNLLIVEEIP